MMSDNGTNFVGAEKILKDELKRIDQGKIHCQMSQRGVKWRIIVSRSQHLGSVWKRLVKFTKVMYLLL